MSMYDKTHFNIKKKQNKKLLTKKKKNSDSSETSLGSPTFMIFTYIYLLF